MALHWTQFLLLPVFLAYVIALVRAETTKQREIVTAALFVGLLAIAAISSLFSNGSLPPVVDVTNDCPTHACTVTLR